jgi:hypothetical protein
MRERTVSSITVIDASYTGEEGVVVGGSAGGELGSGLGMRSVVARSPDEQAAAAMIIATRAMRRTHRR